MRKAERNLNTAYQSVIRSIRQRNLIRTGQHVIVAVSGGIDSVVLLDILASLRKQWKFRLSVAHVNHGLRGRASDLDEKFVRRKAQGYGVQYYSTKVETAQHSAAGKIAVQQAARELRYSFFEDLRKSLKADAVATAHNADDNAETMLFHFFRGSGVQGLTGIPVKRDRYIRPLLSVPRSGIAEYARQHAITYREDESNTKEVYTRNFIRRSVIPQIERRINPSLVATLQKESVIFTMLAEYVNEAVDALYPAAVSGTELSVERLRSMHPFIQRSVVKRLLESMQIEPAFTAIEAIVDLAENQKGTAADINNDFFAERTGTTVSLQRRMPEAEFEFTVPSRSSVTNDRFTFSITSVHRNNKRSDDPSIEYVDAETVEFPLTIRSWKPGDFFIPLGMKGKKKLSDFFGEKKLTAVQKSAVPIVLSGERIIWVGGLRLDDRCKITEHTRSSYKLSFKFYGTKEGHRKQ
jgi:tRNA(Ile)-lysidine synthase